MTVMEAWTVLDLCCVCSQTISLGKQAVRISLMGFVLDEVHLKNHLVERCFCEAMPLRLVSETKLSDFSVSEKLQVKSPVQKKSLSIRIY